MPRKYVKVIPKYNFAQMSPAEVYKLVLTGKIKTFPYGTWSQPDLIEYAVEIIRFFIEKVLNWSERDIKERLSKRLFDIN